MKNANTSNAAVLNDAATIIGRHLKSFRENDLDAVVADYTSSSVLITHDATYRGPEEIRKFFAGMMLHFPNGRTDFELDKLEVDDELAYIVWHATTPSVVVTLGTDTFIIKAGKIWQQTFAGQFEFIE